MSIGTRIDRQADRRLTNGLRPERDRRRSPRAIGKNYSQLPRAPRGGRRARRAAEPQPGHRRPGWASASTCSAATATRSRRSPTATAARSPTSTSARRTSPSTVRRGAHGLRVGREGRLQPRRRSRWPRPRRMRYNGDAAGVARGARQACPAPSSRRPNTCISGRPPFARWAAIPTKSSPCWSGPSTPTAATPARCSAWPWRTIATATTTTPASLYERAATQFPDARRHAAQPGRAVRRHAAVREGPAVLPADPRRVSRSSRGPGCSSRTPTPRATCTTTRKPAAARIG